MRTKLPKYNIAKQNGYIKLDVLALPDIDKNSETSKSAVFLLLRYSNVITSR